MSRTTETLPWLGSAFRAVLLAGTVFAGLSGAATAGGWQGTVARSFDDLLVGDVCNEGYAVEGTSLLQWNCSTQSLDQLSNVPGGAFLEKTPAGDLIAFGDTILRSADGGATWTSVTTSGIDNYFQPRSVAVGPDNALYVNFGNDLYRLAAGASQWQAILQPPKGIISEVGVAPTGTIFALIDTFPQAVMRSSDAGISWDTVEDPDFDSTLIGLAFDSSANIYVGSYWDGVFRSQDGGATWAPASGGLPPDRGVEDLAVAGNSLFALVKDQQSAVGVFRSDDSAESWTSISPEFGVWDLAGFMKIEALGTEALWALSRFEGIARYDLATQTWTRPPPVPHHVREIIQTNDGRLIAGATNGGWGPGGHGAWISSDLGTSWYRTDPDIQDTYATLTSVTADRDANLYFGTYDRRIFIDPASGNPVTSLNLPSDFSPRDIVTDRLGGLYAGRYFEGVAYFPPGASVSEPFNDGLPPAGGDSAPGFLQLERAGDVLYGLANAQSGDYGLFRRNVGQSEWVYLRGSSNVRGIGVLDEDTVMIYGFDGTWFAEVSTDAGQTWSAIAALDGVAIHDFSAAPDGSQVAVATPYEILGSRDFHSWTPLAGAAPGPSAPFESVLIDAFGDLHAGTANGLFTVPGATTVAPTADLRVEIEPGASSASSRAGGASRSAVTFDVTVSNAGPFDASGASVSLINMEGLTDMSWHCNVPESCAPASGTGGVSTIVALPVGDTVVIRVSATVDPDASFTELVVGAEPPEGFVLVGDDTTAASGGSANNDGIFRSRFFDW